MQGGGESVSIDFADVAAAALRAAESVVPQWLRDGRRRGHEWVCGSLSGGEGTSCSVNLVSGKWADFASDERGNDLISLFAAIHGLNQGQAARRIMAELGMVAPESGRRGATRHAAAYPVAARSVPVAAPAQRMDGVDQASQGDQGPRRSLWRPVVPVPEHAPEPDFKHWHYAAPACAWA